jgi:transcriptional regulator with XRE-family HTH domain
MTALANTSKAPTPTAGAFEALGLKLANCRSRRGMSRAELAERIECPVDAVLSAEIGEQSSTREFWALADAVLRANGRLLAAADRSVFATPNTAKQGRPPKQPPPTQEQVGLIRYRQVQRTHRVFADRLSTTAARRQRCPHMTETAANQQTRIADELAALIETIRTLQRRDDFTPNDVLTDLWQTLLTHDPYHASFLNAAALVELARS